MKPIKTVEKRKQDFKNLVCKHALWRGDLMLLKSCCQVWAESKFVGKKTKMIWP